MIEKYIIINQNMIYYYIKLISLFQKGNHGYKNKRNQTFIFIINQDSVNLSRIIAFIMGDKYTHSAIFRQKLEKMYNFGAKEFYPFWADLLKKE